MSAVHHPWPMNTAHGRWYGFGRYLAMFPPAFLHEAVGALTGRGDHVLDPFCGRGNAPFAAAAMGRPAVGIDVNPVGWLFAATKLGPAGDADAILSRLGEIGKARRPADRLGANRFERMAWAPSVRALLRAARRELDWRESEIDRTLMGFVALHMHDKSGGGLSNSMSPTIAYSPGYAVRWWTTRGLTNPPDIDPVAMLTDKIRRRYAYGTPRLANGKALLGDARERLREMDGMDADLLITSPPYRGVTDYWNDHWLRLWLLGHGFGKAWRKAAKYDNTGDYKALLADVFRLSARCLRPAAAVLVRSDWRRRTADLCVEAVQAVWPDRDILVRTTTAPHKGISVHHGRGGSKAKEVDLLLPGRRGQRWMKKTGFVPLGESALATS